MLVLGLLAALAVGIGTVLCAVGMTRRNQLNTQPEYYSGVTDSADNVAILIAAHDRQDRIVAALNSAARVVSVSNIYVVSDDSTDGTATLARDYGAQVVETFGRQGPAGAVESGLTAFSLLDKYLFVLVTDVDTRLDPRQLEHVLPRFADDSVAAVDVLADVDWRASRRHPLAAVLTAYRARSYALAGRRGQARTVPGVARTYRTSCLRELELNPAGLALADFDLTRQLYRRGLGRVVLCPNVTATTAAPGRLADFRRQHRVWYTGFWQSLRRNGFRPFWLAAAVVELVLASLVLALAPLAGLLAIPALRPPAPLSWWAIAITIVVADYLLTLPVAIARRQPRYLLPGLLFPLVRVLDAASLLAALTRSRPGEADPAWLTVAAPQPPARPVKPAKQRNPLLAGLSWLLCFAAVAVVVVRVAKTTATLPPSLSETALANAAYGTRPAVGGALAVTDLQLRMYTSITSAFSRQASVLQAARELSVLSTAVLLLGLLAAAAILRVHPLLTALAVGLLAISGPAIALLTPLGAAVPAAAWLALAIAAAVAAIGWRNSHWLATGTLALLITVVTLPGLIIPIGAGVAAWLATRSSRSAVGGLVVLALTAGLATALWPASLLFPGETPLESRQRIVVLGVIAAAAAGALIVRWLRPAAVGLGAGAAVVAAVGARADALLPALMLGAVLLVTVLVEESVRTHAERGRALAGAAIAGTLALAGAAAGALLAPRSWTPPDHAGLASWAVQNLEGDDIRLVVPAELQPDLDRDLSRAGRRVAAVPTSAGASDFEFVVSAGADRPPGVQLASFGTLAVVLPRSGDSYFEPSSRQAAGAQLAGNPRLTASDAVRAAFREGQVDFRPMALLAAICRDHDITIAEATNPAHEHGSPQPNRILVLSEVDEQPVTDQVRAGPLLAWLRAQEPPFAPADISVTPAGVRISWRLPARFDLPTS